MGKGPTGLLLLFFLRRVCWCLPDPYFYGIFETVRPTNRFFSKVKFTLPNLDDEQALAALDRDPGTPTPAPTQTRKSFHRHTTCRSLQLRSHARCCST